ncbi:hypothetical protein V8B55DRAFT_1493019 [Mucor lusitanicus]|uniref:F-box domain-containing protein n=2 Tax=Mucor circinelloides f. lusitanicus TaxID=29924 RepID=A0A162TIG7_MUCCL|nr:hypothetical protein FB192DRAFT_1362005 [Mucor lusitanicus]OAD04832.1 hypothetical protein MUCCIDRAFT_79925 [Mucor lusitanicus CBS 277.49]
MSKRQRLMDQDWGISSSSSSSDDSSDEEVQAEPKPCGLFKLPFEILSRIFILSGNTELPLVCKYLYQQLYYCHDSIKIFFLVHRAHNNIERAFEDAIKFPFFNMDIMQRFEKMQPSLQYKDKKIPARLFLQDPQDTLEQRDSLILALLEKGASANRPKGYPLIKSAQLGRLDQVKLLVKFGADPTMRNNMALRVCAARNNREMVDYFLDELHVKPDSETLKACVQKNLWDMFHVLVGHGAVPDMSTIDFT